MLPLAIALLTLAAEPRETDSTFANLKPLTEALARAEKVTLFEGLPHQFHEKDRLEAELKVKKTITHHGFPFYAEPLPLKADEAKALRTLAASEKSYQAWAGYKKCGGFHPDYLVEVSVGKESYRMLVCFGCHEVKLFGPKSEVYVDMSDEGLHGLEEALKGRRKSRPKE